MKAYSKYFNELSSLSQRLVETYGDLNLNTGGNVVECMALTYLKLLIINTKSISLLLDNSLYIPTISICRNIFESSFNLDWVNNGDNDNIKKERVYCLARAS